MSQANQSREANIKCKAFSGQGVRLNRVRVDFDDAGNADVTVWDSVAGHFTRCHSIKPSRQGRIVSIITQSGVIAE